LLLKHFEIKKPQVSFHEYNEQRVLPKLVSMLEEGQSIALVTMRYPGDSDPGIFWWRRLLLQGYQ